MADRVLVEGEGQGLIINLVRREGPVHPLSTMAREQAAALERAAAERGGATQPAD